MKTKTRSIWAAVASYAFYQCLMIAAGAFWYFSDLMKTGSPTPDPASSRTFELNNHGDLSYVELWQSQLFHGALFGSVVTGIVIGFLAQAALGKDAMSPFRLIPFALAIIGGAMFWFVAVRLLGGA